MFALLALFAACGDAPPPEPAMPPPAAEIPAEATPAATPAATPEATPEATGPVRQTWEALLASGCDLRRVPVHTPVEARILRNAPFALRGYRFKDLDLRLLFEADGGWYRPALDAPPELPGPERACVDALRAHEDKLAAALPIPPEMAARMTRDHALFQLLRQWGAEPESPYTQPRFHQDDEGTWHMYTRYPGCDDPEVECGGYSLRCPSETPCEGIAAG